MTTEDFTTEEFILVLFCKVDDVCLSDAVLKNESKHPQGKLHPSAIITLGMLYALKGGGQRAFYRWLWRNYRGLFPQLPERTRLFRLLATHRHTACGQSGSWRAARCWGCVTLMASS